MYKKYPKGLKLTSEKEHLVIDNLGIARKLAHAWYNGVVNFEDLQQQAYLTLVDCATKYDASTGNKFSTYAYNCISIVLNNYVQNYNKVVKIPLNKIYKIHKYLTLPEDEKESFRIKHKLKQEDINFYNTYEILSMDIKVVDDYDDVSYFYSIEETGYDATDNKLIINKILNNLQNLITNDTHRLVFKEVILKDFDTSTYKEIAKKYNLRLKDIYDIIEQCQKIMNEHKDEFI